MYLDEMVTLEDHVEEMVVLDVLDPTCVYTFRRSIEGRRTPGGPILFLNIVLHFLSS
jgi:hypothetical protein